VDGNPLAQKAQALILIQHHLAEPFKQQYMTEDNPHQLWQDLKSRFDHAKTVILPAARQDWMNLCVQDHKSIFEYNSELF
jgi:hypothetical protein